MALQGDWKVQALSKTFNLTVGEEIRETAYDLDGNPTIEYFISVSVKSNIIDENIINVK